MTNREKIEMLKDSIIVLYEKEGRSKQYISDLLFVDRKVLTECIKEWELIQADKRYLKPSSEKFLNKNRKVIIDMLNSNFSMTDISEKLKISRSSLLKTYIKNDKELLHYYNLYKQRLEDNKNQNIQNKIEKSSRMYVKDFPEDELWKDILGYENYQISNHGRVRKFVKKYGYYYLVQTQKNIKSNRVFVTLYKKTKKENLNVARLVAFAFVEGYSEINNTVDHKDGDVNNNYALNLEWISQSENNSRAYKNGKPGHKAFSKRKKFKKIILDDKYEFKTIVSLAKFLGVSETQVGRYIDGECKTNHKFEFIY